MRTPFSKGTLTPRKYLFTMEKDIKKYLYDVLIAIQKIETFANGLTVSDLEIIQNKWALERGVSIIGEALYKAKKMDAALKITDLKAIIATRHIVVHDYDIVDSTRLYVILIKHLPVLKKEILDILEEA